MKSPFPGMDPYLEAHWGDVHSSLVTYARDQVQSQLPTGLKARVEEYLTVQTNERRDRAISPDVRVVERPQATWDTGGGVAVEVEIETETAVEPKLLPMPLDEPITLRSIRIIDTQSGNRVVTAIEFLSPANKLNRDGRKQYRQKQKELLRAGVNLVEVDLLRRGRHIVAVPQYMLTAECLTPYRACAVRAWQPGVAEFYPIALQHRLPMIRIPLRETDPDVLLSLQRLIDQAYAAGGYGDDLDYSQKPMPPLRGDDAAWAKTLLEHAKPTGERGASAP